MQCMSYFILFASSFLAATILPFYSEVVLFQLIRDGGSSIMLLLLATLGNTLGAAVNWAMGRYLLHFQHKRWFYFKPDQMAKIQRWFQRYGLWSLLLAWAPVIGDPITFVAGVMRVPLPVFLVLTAVGKSMRYIAVIYFSQMSITWF